MFLDKYYLLLVVPALLISLWAQMKVKTTFSKYEKVLSRRGMSADSAVRRILDANGLQNVRIERISGHLTDHFDPRTNVVRLSDSVYGSSSVASIGVAAHEAGHAVQHAVGYLPIKLRAAVLPVANFGSRISVPLIILGIVLSYGILIDIGIILFSAAVAFQLITLPVEFNASRRAILVLENGFLDTEEVKGAKSVLTSAALTYVAAALTSVAQLLRLVLISKNRRR